MEPKKIKAKLILRGIRQSQIAEEIGVDRSLICNVIHGRYSSKRVRRAIAKRIGLPIEKIWPKYQKT